MIQLKLKDAAFITDNGPILNPGIAAVLRATRLPPKAMYQLRRIGGRLTREIQTFAETRADLIREMGEEAMEEYDEKDADGKLVKKTRPTGQLRVKPENLAEFFAKQKELLEMDIQIDLNPLKESDLGDKYEGITAADLMQCSFIVEG